MALIEPDEARLFAQDIPSSWSPQKPFLKWAGNKNRAKQFILPHLPTGNRLIEPFAGSCAISLNAKYAEYIIADGNKDLIDLYSFIKEDVDSIIDKASVLFDQKFNNADAFYALREEFNLSKTSVRKSAIFIYLNRHCFNGLCRYNLIGGFNVPFGKYSGPSLPVDDLIAFSKFAEKASFLHQDFTVTIRQATKDDVIYCDPPYIPLSASSNFTAYAKESFGPNEQEQLAKCAVEASRRGCHVLISNHDTEISRKLYGNAEIISFDVMRLISSKASTRGKAKEILALFNV